jgi:hypothetical protein
MHLKLLNDALHHSLNAYNLESYRLYLKQHCARTFQKVYHEKLSHVDKSTAHEQTGL